MSDTEHETGSDSEASGEPKLAGILTFPPEVVAALDEHCAVERLPRDRAICEIVAEYLRFKGYLRRRPAHEHRSPQGEMPEGL
ncbi:hypothetical protein MPPM_4200 [Methylorubrum populi]|uniref:Uncharacterized protein n=1 Tax=Methylorubrum populi TaxID=223967 RepID=A0A160PIU2_9HYPH|nr:hypothetical protein [Methylorubrum populi]BAU92805.1 hypothetical protein MPPM_4200 [Methylorubrum populi]